MFPPEFQNFLQSAPQQSGWQKSMQWPHLTHFIIYFKIQHYISATSRYLRQKAQPQLFPILVEHLHGWFQVSYPSKDQVFQTFSQEKYTKPDTQRWGNCFLQRGGKFLTLIPFYWISSVCTEFWRERERKCLVWWYKSDLFLPVEVNDDVGILSSDLSEPQRSHSTPHA